MPLRYSLVIGCLVAMLAGCSREAEKAVATAPATVSVSLPLEREIIDYEDLTGRTEAVESVEIRARVSGYLMKVNFEPGAEVKKGDLLFEIDPRPYQAQLDKALGQLAVNEARAKLRVMEFARAKKVAETPGAISQQDLDKAAAAHEDAEADVKAAKANLETFRLDLNFTKVTAPINGRISRNLITVGNLVSADNTLLTSIVSVDPIYAYFDVDERTLLRYERMVREGKIKAKSEREIPVFLGLAEEEGYPHQGTIDFVENRLDPTTGTIRLRALFPNPPTSSGERVLKPGLFARIRVACSDPHKALLVTERALGTDQGQKFLYVVNEKNEVVYRPVTVGDLNDGLRVIEKGLQAGERVIIRGLQRVRPEVVVEPKLVEMPQQSAVRGQ